MNGRLLKNCLMSFTEAAHATFFLLWHFRVNHAVTRRHPLHATFSQFSNVAHMIYMTHVAVEQRAAQLLGILLLGVVEGQYAAVNRVR